MIAEKEVELLLTLMKFPELARAFSVPPLKLSNAACVENVEGETTT